MLDPSDVPTMRSRARVGRVLRDKWQVDRLLGVGGMAAVYAATHTKNGRKVALKVLHPEMSMMTDVRARFLREGYAANKLDHPGTVAILDDDTAEDGSVFLVMELLEGETLEDRRVHAGGTLPPAEVLRVAERILDVLAVAHDKGIVHRDLKPENVFLTKDGGVKILDFGIARIREESSAKATMTSAGAMGTPGYMPPEQARGRWNDVGPRTDLWALGATMFVLLTGRLVHEAETLNELLLAAMTSRAPAVAAHAPDVPAEVAALIDRALVQEMDGRWPDARAMTAALRAAQQSLTGAGARPRMPSVTDRPPALATPIMTAPIAPAAVAPIAPAAVAPLAPIVPAPMPAPPIAPAPQAVAPALVAPAPVPPALVAPAPVFVPPPFLGPGSHATGNPVTMSPEPARALTGAAPPGKSRLGLGIVAGMGAAILLGGALLILFGHRDPAPVPPPAATTEPTPSAAPTSAPPAGTTTAAPLETATAAPVETTEPSSGPSAAPSTSASAKKPLRTKTVQDLLNRRH